MGGVGGAQEDRAAHGEFPLSKTPHTGSREGHRCLHVSGERRLLRPRTCTPAQHPAEEAGGEPTRTRMQGCGVAGVHCPPPPHWATWGCVPIHVCASWSSELGGALPVLPVGTSCLLLTEDAPPVAPLRGPAALGAPAPGPPGAQRPGPGPRGSQCGRWSYCCVEAKCSFQKLSRRFCVPRTQQQQQGSQEILPAQSPHFRGITIQTSGGLR